jgi:hypothetical protein
MVDSKDGRGTSAGQFDSAKDGSIATQHDSELEIIQRYACAKNRTIAGPGFAKIFFLHWRDRGCSTSGSQLLTHSNSGGEGVLASSVRNNKHVPGRHAVSSLRNGSRGGCAQTIVSDSAHAWV